MGMGHAGTCADAIDEENLAKLFPQEFNALKDAIGLSPCFAGIEQLAREYQEDSNAAAKDTLVFNALNVSFRQACMKSPG